MNPIVQLCMVAIFCFKFMTICFVAESFVMNLKSSNVATSRKKNEESNLIRSLKRPNQYMTRCSALNSDYIDAVNEIMSGFAGGTVGVMGTLISLELKKKNVEKRSVCPYCVGAGTLTCARCYGLGSLTVRRVSDGQGVCRSISCPFCSGLGGVTCNICRGDGASVPPVLEYKGVETQTGAASQLGRMPKLEGDEYIQLEMDELSNIV